MELSREHFFNHKECYKYPPCIFDVTDKAPKDWYLSQHKELQTGQLYAHVGSLMAGEIKFKINGDIYAGSEVNFLQTFGGTGYGIFVIDKENPIKS